MFSPVLFSIGVITAPDPDASLEKLRESLAQEGTPSDSGFVLAPDVVAFANRHPDLAKDILVEVQALTEEARARGLKIVTDKVTESIGSFFDWEDVTAAALAYHLELKNSEKAATDETPGI